MISAGTMWVFEKSFEAKAIVKINFFCKSISSTNVP